MAGRVTRSKGRKCTPGNYEKYLGNKYEDPEGFEPKFLNSEVGHGLFAVKDFLKGAFLLEYKGETISEQEAGRREYTSHHSYQFFFQHEGKTMCIDASDTNHLARLVNDSAPSKRSCNARMRKIISCSGTLHLCLFSLRDIEQGEEIRYDYAAKGLSWRKKEKLYNKIALSVDSRNEDDGNYETVLDSEDDGGLNSGLSNFKRLQHINEAIIECCNGKNDKGKACIKESGYKCRDENEQGGSAASRGRNEDEPGILTPLEDVIHTDPEFAPDSGDRDKQDPDVAPDSGDRDKQNPDVAPDSGDRDKQNPDVAPDSGDSGKQDSDVAPDSGDRDKQDPDVAPDSGDRDKQNPDVTPDSGDRDKQNPDVAPDSRDRDKQDPDVAPDSGDRDKQDPDVTPDSGDRDKQNPDVTPDSGDRDKQNPDVAPDSRDRDKQDPDVAPDSGDRDKQDPDVAPDSGDRDKQNPDVAPNSRYRDKQTPDCTLDSADEDKQTPDVAPDPADRDKQDDDFAPDSADDDNDDFAPDPVDDDDKDSDFAPDSADEDDSDSTDFAPDSADDWDNDTDFAPDPVDGDKQDPDLTQDSRDAGHSVTVINTQDPSTVDEQPTVMCTDNTNGRKYNKGTYCPFCQRYVMKFPRHLREFKAHKNEPQVVEWLATQDNKLLTKMRNYGNFLHNAEVLKNKEGVLIPVYRPNKKDADCDKYVPCNTCYGFFAKRDLWKHSCVFDEKTDEPVRKRMRRNRVKAGKMMLPFEGSEAVRAIFAGLRDDEEGVGSFIKNDPLMKKLADKFALKLGHDSEQYNHIRNKLREVGRMVLQYRRKTKNSTTSLADLIDPSKFRDVVEATRTVAGFDGKRHLYVTPSLALKLGHTMKKVCNILLAEGIMAGDKVLEDRCNNFSKLLDMNWHEQVSSHALRTLTQNKRNNPQFLPITTDIQTLASFLKKEMKHGKQNLLSDPSNIQQHWKHLSEVTLTLLLVFNRKRSGEVSKMRVEDLHKCRKGSEGLTLLEGLSKWEQELCKMLWRIEIVGKKGRTVPMLLTEVMKDSLDLLNHNREKAGVLDDNKFVFAMLHSNGHIRGCDTLRKHADLCGASRPEFLRSTRLRKHIGTVSQLMNLERNEEDILAKFLGHDIHVHREYYRLPDETLQLAKVSKVLLQLDSGDLSCLSGKGLDDIQLDKGEEVILEDPLEPNDDNENIADVSGCSPTTSSEEKVIEYTQDLQKTRRKLQKRGCSPTTSAEEKVIEYTQDLQKTRRKLQKRGPKRVKAVPEKLSTGKRNQIKRPWTPDEKAAVHETFHREIFQNRLPGKGVIQQCLNKKAVLHKRTWTQVKDFIRNYLKYKGNKGFL
eukprot:XP_011667872.1 PREDICTED: uncharacterized protein LOC100891939 [Strongylocentrotus purpuratus]